MTRVEHLPEELIENELFDGLHLKPVTLDREWVHGWLQLEDSKRSRLVRSHLGMCKTCRECEQKILQKDRDEDWKLAQLPESDRD
ncbi:MAG: hypothetical protein Q8P69_01825 [bacterium]|nr:hypothetical protein [bacterium]